jgi:16S rRNA (cytosine967-C5)-methyltransferase
VQAELAQPPDDKSPKSASPSKARFDVHQFDRVLLDVPCSNTGVMRRRVDLRWRLSLTEIDRLRANQLQLLHQATVLLKPGGTLVYSTCSLEPEENAELLASFIKNHPELALRNERELRPFSDSVDGAYTARLERAFS